MSVSSAALNTEKGGRYFGQLDQALCNGNWSEIEELARKTLKHAPQRKCFAVAANAEAHIAAASNHKSSPDGLHELVPKLNEAIAGSSVDRHPEDVYAAQVCLAEIYFLQDDHTKALEALPIQEKPTTAATARASHLGWTEVCEVKAEYIRLVGLIESAKEEEARKACLNIATQAPGSRAAELRRWTERVLAKACLFMSGTAGEPTLQSLSQSLRSFFSWSDFWQRAPSSSSGGKGASSKLDISRRSVWRAYYELISIILQHGLLFNLSPKSPSDLLRLDSDQIAGQDYLNAKARQRTNMRKVEVSYESLLLNETKFPRASETNTEVEEWVQQVVSNWKTFSGPAWTDTELGDSGKEGLGRTVLDILYRAATKTYHSTAILRYLFQVHAALGEFDLAMHAFNSYVEIIDKDKARAEKQAEQKSDFDSDDSVLLTAADAVRILCRYGSREQGEKAIEVGRTIKKWLSEAQLTIAKSNTRPSENTTNGTLLPSHESGSTLKATTLAAAYRAIGISQANWARLTYDTPHRTDLSTEALDNLRLALSYNEKSIETAYALALLLAERRDVLAATQILKQVIASVGLDEVEDEQDAESDDFTKERMLVPLWHLLALCLTAKDGYEQGARACDAAFAQFGDPAVLLGGAEDTANSEESEKVGRSSQRNVLVDQMEAYEKEAILQIKMSQLALVELMEGVDAAVDTSYELLGLYGRLFGNVEIRVSHTSPPPPTAASATPSRLGGTLRSIAGSIRPKSMRDSMDRDPRTASRVSVLAKKGEGTDRASQIPATDDSVGVPIAITVTNEDGVPTEKSSHHKHLSFRRHRDHGNLGTTGSTSSFRKGGEKLSTVPETLKTPPQAASTTPVTDSNMEKSQSADIMPSSSEQPLEAVPHNAPHDAWPPPPGHEQQPPEQDVRLPAPHPSTHLVPDARLPTAQDRQQRISLLVKIWLFTAGLYLRAKLLDDAGSAINEANQLVEAFEAEVGDEHSSARRFYNKGWGGGNSVDGLWADIWSAKGYLSVARSLPFAAINDFEQALSYFPDHPDAIIGLSNLLMDMYEEKIPAEEPLRPISQQPSASNPTITGSIPPQPRLPLNDPNKFSPAADDSRPSVNNGSKLNKDPTPAELNRLAARDRAYMLLANLTRLGSGWDHAEAWSTLARAHELSNQFNKAKEALWWVVELEENEPMRAWSEIAAGGFTL